MGYGNQREPKKKRAVQAPWWPLSSPLQDHIHKYGDVYCQGRRFPPGSWVRTRPLLRPRVHPIVDSTKFWESVGDGHIRLWRCLHIGRECYVSHTCRRTTFIYHLSHFTTTEYRHQRRFPNVKYKCVGGRGSAPRPCWRSLQCSARPYSWIGERRFRDGRSGEGEGREGDEWEQTRPSSGENRRPCILSCTYDAA